MGMDPVSSNSADEPVNRCTTFNDFFRIAFVLVKIPKPECSAHYLCPPSPSFNRKTYEIRILGPDEQHSLHIVVPSDTRRSLARCRALTPQDFSPSCPAKHSCQEPCCLTRCDHPNLASKLPTILHVVITDRGHTYDLGLPVAKLVVITLQ
ncbi:unnamed protein product [Hymenolepis diminuta]|uniref:Uncharacterized protein n=1 Tax=Hymenolepis diminuta TaxID=6216 RepID=A0A564Y485_HYMDI|nr:unnamed protein product [Hymenolepis diminuta]